MIILYMGKNASNVTNLPARIAKRLVLFSAEKNPALTSRVLLPKFLFGDADD